MTTTSGRSVGPHGPITTGQPTLRRRLLPPIRTASPRTEPITAPRCDPFKTTDVLASTRAPTHAPPNTTPQRATDSCQLFEQALPGAAAFRPETGSGPC